MKFEKIKRRKGVMVLLLLGILWLIGTYVVWQKGAGWAASYIILSIYYLIILIGMKETNAFQTIKEWSIQFKLSITLCCVAVCLIVFFVISKERFVYFWDYSSYMYYTVNVSKNFSEMSFLDAMRNLWNSINCDEYNIFICYIIAIPFKIFKQKYIAFEMLTVVMFFVPAIFLMVILMQRILGKMGFKHTDLKYLFIGAIFFPCFIYVILLGYVDAVGLPIMALSFLIAIENQKKFDLKKDIILSIALVELLLLRRWFAAFLLSYVLFLLCNQILITLNKDKKEKLASWMIFFKNYILVGVISLVILMVGFRGVLGLLFMNSYKESYAGWNSLSISQKWYAFFKYFGLLVLAGFVGELVCEIRNRKNKKEIFFGISTVLGIIVSAMYFWLMADMPEHVYYIFSIQMLIGNVLFLSRIEDSICDSKKKCVILGVIEIGIILLNFMTMLGITRINNEKLGLMTGNRYQIRYRADMDELEELNTYLEELTIKLNNDKVYVAASSEILNDDVLRRLNAPEYERGYTLLSTTHADLVGGINTDILDTEVIVLASPDQLHLEQGSQLVQEYIYKSLLDEESVMGSKYEMIRKFSLENNVEAFVYLKQDSYTIEDISAIENYFDSCYGEYPELFHDKFEAYKNEVFPRQRGAECVVTPEDNILESNYYCDGNIISTQADTLAYGPYTRIAQGVYDITFTYEYSGELTEGTCIGYIDVNIPGEEENSFNYTRKDFYVGDSQVVIDDWLVEKDYTQAEVRMVVYTPGVEMTSVIIEHE